jgi:hypothetical protein
MLLVLVPAMAIGIYCKIENQKINKKLKDFENEGFNKQQKS